MYKNQAMAFKGKPEGPAKVQYNHTAPQTRGKLLLLSEELHASQVESPRVKSGAWIHKLTFPD